MKVMLIAGLKCYKQTKIQKLKSDVYYLKFLLLEANDLNVVAELKIVVRVFVGEIVNVVAIFPKNDLRQVLVVLKVGALVGFAVAAADWFVLLAVPLLIVANDYNYLDLRPFLRLYYYYHYCCHYHYYYYYCYWL